MLQFFCLLTIILANEINSTWKSASNLPNGCNRREYVYGGFKNITLIDVHCTNMNAELKFADKCQLNKNFAQEDKQNFDITLEPNKRDYIMKGSNQLLRLMYCQAAGFIDINIRLINLKGFYADSPLEKDTIVYLGNFKLLIQNTRFNLYDRSAKLVEKCEQTKYSRFILSDFLWNQVEFHQVQFKNPICELIFHNAFIIGLLFDGLVQSYYKSNVVKFVRQNLTEINSTIEFFTLSNVYEIELDREILNEKIFRNVIFIELGGKFRSIDVGLFKPFGKIRNVFLSPDYFPDLLRRHGIEWMKSINSDLNVDLNDTNELFKNRDRNVRFAFSLDRSHMYSWARLVDQDFCLFKDFPFNQLIFLTTSPLLNCLDIWLYNHYKYVWTDGSIADYPNLDSERCEFEKMLNLCNKSQRQQKPARYDVSLDFMITVEFLLILSSPLVSLLSLAANLISFLVIVHKDNRKQLKEKQYTYMGLNCVSNGFICLISILSLVNTCQYPFGIYCSSIRGFIFVQYFKIIVGEYFNSLFRVISNLSYLAFCVNRLSLVGNKPNSMVVFVSNMRVKTFTGLSLVFGASISVAKGFKYEINVKYPDSQPILFSQIDTNMNWFNELKYKLVFITLVISDLVNYIIFVVLGIVLDVWLVKKVFEVIKEREETFKTQNEFVREKVKKENEESKRRVVFMVVVNLVVNLLFKIPMTVAPLNDMRLLLTRDGFNSVYLEYRHWSTFPYSMLYFCSSDRICEIFQSFADLLYLVSLSFNFFLLRKFDKLFGFSLQKLLNRIK